MTSIDYAHRINLTFRDCEWHDDNPFRELLEGGAGASGSFPTKPCDPDLAEQRISPTK